MSTATFGYTGNVQYYTVPANAGYVVIKAWGAGGGGGRGTPGGGGALVTASYYISPGATIQLRVGQGGGAAYAFGNNRTGGWPNGGAYQGTMGGGGGRTEVVTPNGMIVAGAGGGGGDYSGYSTMGGGGGGNPNGQSGFGSPISGGGGSTTAGGYGGSGDEGSGAAGGFKQGGQGGPYAGWQGGGGGDGYYGGGGGGSNYNNGLLGGSGGGGSSWVGGSPISYSYTAANWITPGGQNDSDYPGADPFHSASELPKPSNIAYGGNLSGDISVGGNGYVVIRVYQLPQPPSMPNPLPARYVNQRQAISYTIPATGDPMPSSYGASGLPAGLSLNASSGVISGSIAEAGVYSCTVSATNAYGTTSSTLTWNVAAASVTANGSVVPGAVQQGQSVTLYRDGTANFGIAWTENVIWKPDGTYVTLGNQYGTSALGSTSYTPNAGPGTYYYQLRVADIYYNYKDQWIPFYVNPQTHTPPYSTSFEQSEGYVINGNLYPQFGWLVQKGAADVSSEQAQTGSVGVKLIAGSQRAQVQKFFAGNQTDAFVDVQARPVAATVAEDSFLMDNGPSRIAFTTANGSGVILAYNGNGAGSGTWTNVGTFSINGSNQSTSWLRFTAHHDYSAKRWHLIVNGVRVASDLGFVSNGATSLTDITWWGTTTAAAYLDNFSAFTSNPFPPSAVPAEIAASGITDGGLTLNWSVPLSPASAVVEYQIQRAGGPTASTTSTSLAVSGLYPATTYSFTIRARNQAGYWSGWSAPFIVATLADQTPPSVPGGLAASELTPLSVRLSWQPSSDNVGVTGYRVTRVGGPAQDTTGTTLVLSGLLPEQSYTFNVQAFDTRGNISPAASINVSTPEPDPNADYDEDGVSTGIELLLGLNPYTDPNDVRVFNYNYDKANQLKTGPGGEYLKDAEGNIKEVKSPQPQ